MSFVHVFFIKFVLFYLPQWASGDKNLCSTLHEGSQGTMLYMWDDVVSCPSGESLPHTLLHRYISPGKKYTGARGDFALEMQKRALEIKKSP